MRGGFRFFFAESGGEGEEEEVEVEGAEKAFIVEEGDKGRDVIEI